MSESVRRTFRDGSWLAVFGTDLTVVLPGRERGRAARLWELVDGGARFEEVLDALVSPTLSEAGDFVLVRARDGDVRLLVRGAPVVRVTTAGGETEVSAGDLVWAERTVGEVESMTLSLPDSRGSGELRPAVPGLVRVDAVVWGAGREESSRGPAPALPRQGPETADLPLAAPAEAPETQAVVAADPGPAPEPEPEPDPAPEPEPETDLLPFEEPAPDRDGQTRFGTPPPPPVPPGIPGQPVPPAVLARPVARLVFSHGETVAVDRAVVIGRAPEARRHAAGEQPLLVTVPSPGQEISSTHLEIRPGAGVDHGTAAATDLGSTNGTVVMQPGLPPEELQPGIAMSLVPGTVLDLGDGITIQVTRA